MKLSNATSINNANLDLKIYLDEEFKWIKFKYLPYSLKKASQIETMNFNKCIERFWCGDDFVYNNIKNEVKLERIENNIFQFIHAEGAHTPFNYDRDLNYIQNGTYSQKIEACITLINAYLQRLKNNGVYDNSIIIIMADHGAGGENDDIILGRANPILLIKGFNEKHNFFTSDLPVSYYDLIDAYTDLLDGRNSTELFSNISYSRLREFICYFWFTETDHMVEYETEGTARDWQNFRETGNVYDR